MASENTAKDIVEMIGNTTVNELVDVIELLKEKFGVSDDALTQSAGAGASVGGAAEQEEDVKVNVMIKVTDAKEKVKAIKALKTELNLGLKEAKEFVDKSINGEDVIIKEGIEKKEAEEIVSKLSASGVLQVSIK